MCGEMEIASAMFGFVPHWANLKMVRQIYSARTEIVVRDLPFRSDWKRKQFCIIPAANFSSATAKPASLCTVASSAPMVGRWPSPGDGNIGRLISCCLSRC